MLGKLMITRSEIQTSSNSKRSGRAMDSNNIILYFIFYYIIFVHMNIIHIQVVTL